MTSSPGGNRDARVDAYIAALPAWQQQLCEQLRELIHAAEPEIEENLFLYDGAIVPDPAGIITAGHENKTARQIGFWEGDPINGPALTAMLRQIAENNRAGGWRRLKRG